MIIPLRITAPPHVQEQMVPSCLDPSSLPSPGVCSSSHTGGGSPCSVTLGSDIGTACCMSVSAGTRGKLGLDTWVWPVSWAQVCCWEKGTPSVFTQAEGGRQVHVQPGASQLSLAKISRWLRNEHLSVMTANTLGLLVMTQ